jgi:hypothetical protein
MLFTDHHFECSPFSTFHPNPAKTAEELQIQTYQHLIVQMRRIILLVLRLLERNEMGMWNLAMARKDGKWDYRAKRKTAVDRSEQFGKTVIDKRKEVEQNARVIDMRLLQPTHSFGTHRTV